MTETLIPAAPELRDALQQALDRMRTAFDHVKPRMTPDDREAVAQSLWFGMEEIDRILGSTPDQMAEPR